MTPFDFWTDTCGDPLAHAEHAITTMAGTLLRNGYCKGKAYVAQPIVVPKDAEPRCTRGNVLKHHTGPCGAGCQYPATPTKEKTDA